jgi:MerR HTH family regulatory protein
MQRQSMPFTVETSSFKYDLVSVRDAAKILDLCAATVRLYSDTGILPIAAAPQGWRLFERSDVERLRELRKAQPPHVMRSRLLPTK